MVTPVAGGVLEETAPVSVGEGTERNRHTVEDRGRVSPFLGDEVVPEPVLESPEDGSLTHEGGAVNATDSREELGVIAGKILEDRLILVIP